MKKTAKKSASKKVAKKAVKKAASKKSKAAAKTPAKKVAKKAVKAAIKKTGVKAKGKASPRKAVKAPKTITKTAARKAARAAKAAKTVVKAPAKVKAPPKPVWPPLVEAALKRLDDAKAEDIVTIDLTGKSTLADTMIVASGRSNRHVNAIADQVVEELKKHGQSNLRVEGIPQCDWVVVDAGDILLHIFRPEVRSFYNLEKLWSAHVPE